MTPPGVRARHAQPATKHEIVLGSALTHTPEGEYRVTGLAISVVMMMAALLH